MIKVTFVRSEQVKSDRPDLQNAKTVLAGGRGLVDEAEFAEMGKLADKLGAASVRPALWSTPVLLRTIGRSVRPVRSLLLTFIIGFGISGAIQYIAGIKDAKVIVAVNKDPEAPIFDVADYGLVGDAMTVIRELEAKL